MDKVRIGWLEDKIGIVGGAELSSATLRHNAPDWAEVVLCPPNKRPPTDEISLFLLQNVVTYGSRWVPELARRPVIRQFRDPNYAGSALLRRWLLDNAELLLFSSPMQMDAFEYPSELPARMVPPPVNVQRFKAAALPPGQREGNVFVGRCDVFKGAHVAVDWAIRENQPLDLYGMKGMNGGSFLDFGDLPDTIRFHGQVPYEQMPDILGRAKRLVFFPSWPEAFGRAVVEAWAAGCELVVNGRIGSLWWIQEHPEALEQGVKMFWDAVAEVAR